MPTLAAVLRALAPALWCPDDRTDLTATVSQVLLLGSHDPAPQSPEALALVTDPRALEALDGRVAAFVVKESDRDLVPRTQTPLVLARDDLPWHDLVRMLTDACLDPTGEAADGDLFAFVNSVAAVVGGAVVIEDSARRVLAHSSLPGQPIDEIRRAGIVGREAPQNVHNDANYAQLIRSAGVVRLPGDAENFGRLAVAVRAGGEVLGSLWMVESEQVDDAAQQRLLSAARTAAVHLLRARAEDYRQRVARSELLRAVLEGRTDAASVARSLSLNPSGDFTVLALGLPSAAAGDLLTVHGVSDLVQLQSASVSPRTVVVAQYDTLVVLLPSDGLSRARIHDLAQDILRRASAAHRLTLSCGIGATVTSLGAVTTSAADALAVLHLVGPGEVGNVETLLPQVVLLEWASFLERNARLRLPVVDRISQHDAREQSAYAISALAYLQADGDVAVAAEAVGVHPNTFRYRLKRLRDLFGLDLTDADTRLVLWLQLRATLHAA